jgi:hypothetical protein
MKCQDPVDIYAIVSELALFAQIVVMETGLPGQLMEQDVKLFLLIDGMTIVTIILVLAFLVAVISEISVDSLPIPHSQLPQIVHSCKNIVRRIEICSLHITYIFAVLPAWRSCVLLEASQQESGRQLPTKRATKKEQNQAHPCTQNSPHACAYLTSDFSLDVSATPAHGVYVWSWYLGICIRLAPRSRHRHLHKNCSANSNVG